MGLSWLLWLVTDVMIGLAGIDAYVGRAGIILGEIASQTRWVESVAGRKSEDLHGVPFCNNG